MICFELVCGNAHRFEAWFRSGAVYEEQEAAGELVCPLCGDREIRKAPMAPAVTRSRDRADGGRMPAAADGPEGEAARRREVMAAILRQMRAVQTYVEKNFEDVGDRFAEEARRIHDGESERRGIYGRTDPEEARALRDEGIPVYPLPRLPKLDA